MRVAKGELIGLFVTVTGTNHPPYESLDGRIVDETKNTFLLETEGGEIRIPKRGQTFRFRNPEGVTFEFSGDRLAHSPQDRTKKAR